MNLNDYTNKLFEAPISDDDRFDEYYAYYESYSSQGKLLWCGVGKVKYVEVTSYMARVKTFEITIQDLDSLVEVEVVLFSPQFQDVLIPISKKIPIHEWCA